jgi:uncharacterized protein (DUF1810 family)
MTLFSYFPTADFVLQNMLDKIFEGKKDEKTLAILETAE